MSGAEGRDHHRGGEPRTARLDAVHCARLVSEEPGDPSLRTGDDRAALAPNLLAEEVHGAGGIEPCVGPGEKAFRAGREGDVRLERPEAFRVE